MNLFEVIVINVHSPSIDPDEVEKFSRMAAQWWDVNGKFMPLHRLNPLRAKYIADIISGIQGNGDLSILDIGCGGGLLAESIAGCGVNITGIDASYENIQTAHAHARQSGVNINYICSSAEELAASGAQFDIVLNMEVIEHVADVKSFMHASCKLVKPGGVMVIATLNRTIKSFVLAIMGAEYILHWLPKGTHKWQKFLKPSEINEYLKENSLNLEEIKGVTFNPVRKEWGISGDISVNYMMKAVKAVS